MDDGPDAAVAALHRPLARRSERDEGSRASRALTLCLLDLLHERDQLGGSKTFRPDERLAEGRRSLRLCTLDQELADGVASGRVPLENEVCEQLIIAAEHG
jgi:hypothetical protein